MADDNRARSKGKPPPHIESYLTAKHSCSSFKIRPRKYYCVLYGNLIQCFNNEKSYTEKRENVRTQIDLDLVRSISETISLPASRQKQEYCFKLVFYNDNEVDFIAQSKQDVKNWVECLIQTKKFWESWEQNEQFEITNKEDFRNSLESNHVAALEVPDEERDLIKVSIIMSHGQPYTAYIPPDGTLDDLWTAVLKSLPGHFCFKCYTCQLRGSTMELWSVTNNGVAYKIEKHFNLAEYCSTASSPIYLLEHNFKLLVVFFEDSSFLVSPADISTKARDIPNIELFSRKLSEIECSNVQLYLKTSSGTVTPFSMEDSPLRTLWELHGDKWALKPREGEKFILKSRVILRNNPENIAEKIQQRKLITKIRERKQKEVLNKIEIHGCTSKMKKILGPLVPATKTLPFEVSLPSSPDMHENYFTCETKHHIQPITFIPSPEKTAVGQLSAPFCPPDNLGFPTTPSKPCPKETHNAQDVTMKRQRSLTANNLDFTSASSKTRNKETCDTQEFTVRRQRSLTDVTQYRTGSNNEINKRASDAGSIRRTGAIRRKSSRDSLYSFPNCTIQGEQGENELVNTNANLQSRNLSCESDQEKVTHEKTADIDSKEAQSVPEVTSSKSEDERTSREQADIRDQDDKTRDSAQNCGSSSGQQDNGQLEQISVNMLSTDIVSNEGAVEDIENDVHSDSGIDSFDGSIKNEVGQLEYSESKDVQPHSCDYYVIGRSTYFLKNILDQYSRLIANEEEVGVDHPPQGICLSSYHLLHVEGRWVLENNVELDEENNEQHDLEDYEIFTLPGDIRVLFHRSKRNWVVKRINVDDEQLEEVETPNDQLLANEEDARVNTANENPCSTEEKEAENFRYSTWKSDFHPLTINNCGQHFRPLDDSYEIEDEQPTAQDFTEIRILEDTIQKLFYHMEKHRDLPAAECLDDTKYPDVRRLVCVELCSALNKILSNGLKKRHTLLSAIRYNVWEVVKGTSTNSVTSVIVKKINSVGAVDDKTRFELFVCECLNQKAGALASWVEILQNDKKKLNTYYDEQALVMKLPKDTLEKLVSRITFLPFSINFYQHVQKKMKDVRDVTQFTFE